MEGRRVRFGRFCYDTRGGLLQAGGAQTRLQPQVAQLLSVLIAHPGELVDHDTLMDTLWPDSVVGPEALTQTVSRLRRALGETSRAPRHLETLHKRGYRFLGEVVDDDVSATGDPVPTDAPWTHTTLHGAQHHLGRRFPSLTLAAHPDLERVGETARLTALRLGEAVALSRLEPGFRRLRADVARPIADPFVSRSPVRLAADGDAITLTSNPVAGLRVDGRPVDKVARVSASELARGVVLELGERVALVLHDAAEPKVPRRDLGVLGSSYATGALRNELRRLIERDVHLLVCGPDGADLAVVGRALAAAPTGSARPLVTLAADAAPPAFDEAMSAAAGGVLVVRDADLLPTEAAARLARLAASEVRLVLETHLPAAAATIHPTLRAIPSYPIELTPLEGRRADVAPLLLAAVCATMDAPPWRGSDAPWVAARLLARLVQYDWPGEDAQLRTAARQLAILGADGPVDRLPSWLDAVGGAR